MVLQIRQVNKDNFESKEDIFQLLKRGWLIILHNHNDIYIFAKKKLLCFEKSTYPTQILYVLDTETGKISDSLTISIRNSTVSNKENIVISMVNTVATHRKIELMEKLFNFMIALYKDNDFDLVKNYFTFHDKFIFDSHEFFMKNITDGSFWTLYCLIGDYYAKYNFTSIKTMNYYIVPCIDISSSDFDITFKTVENETLLTLKNAAEYLIGDEYTPDIQTLSEDNVHCCSFEDGSITTFLHGNEVSYREKGICILHHELIIESHTETTIFCITNLYNMKEFTNRRFFSNVTDPEILMSHLDRVYQYITWHMSSICMDKADSAVMFCEGDIVTSTEDRKQPVLDYQQKKWTWCDDNMCWNVVRVEEQRAGW